MNVGANFLAPTTKKRKMATLKPKWKPMVFLLLLWPSNVQLTGKVVFTFPISNRIDQCSSRLGMTWAMEFWIIAYQQWWFHLKSYNEVELTFMPPKVVTIWLESTIHHSKKNIYELFQSSDARWFFLHTVLMAHPLEKSVFLEIENRR